MQTSILLLLLFLHGCFCSADDAASPGRARTAPSTRQHFSAARKLAVRDRVETLFLHGYDSYMRHAFPQDELKPLSCQGHNTFGGYALTLIDSLDTLAMMGFEEEFMHKIQYIHEQVHFNANMHVSVFETTIRVLGGLISAHGIAVKLCAKEMQRAIHLRRPLFTSYDGQMLRKAVQVADKLVPAFDTPTGIPFNEIHFRNGVDRSKGHVTCPAAAGSLLLEFGVLASLTSNCTYLTVAKRALEGVWKHRSRHHLIGTMIDLLTGRWVQPEAGIGASIDSFYEYLFKAYILFGEDAYLEKWQQAYKAILRYNYHDGWYLSSHSENVSPPNLADQKLNALQAFWPGLQVIAGDVTHALEGFGKLYCVVRDYTFLPEYMHLGGYLSRRPNRDLGAGYPLRPEFIESLYFLYTATNEEHLLNIAETFLNSFERTKQACGFAAVLNIYDFSFEDKMDSYVLAETFKYFYLLFTPSVKELAELADTKGKSQCRKKERRRSESEGGDCADDYDDRSSTTPVPPRAVSPLVHDMNVEGYVFNTEAHPLPLDSATQFIHSACAFHERSFVMPHNDVGRVDEAFTMHHAAEYEGHRADLHPSHHQQTAQLRKLHQSRRLETRKERSRQCPVINYMRDVAPFVQDFLFPKPGRRDRCYDSLVHIVLGPREVSPQHGGISGGNTEDPRATTTAQVPITIPTDPVALSAVQQEPINLILQVTSPVASSASSQSSSHAPVYRGVVRLDLLGADPEMLYMSHYNVFIRSDQGSESDDAGEASTGPSPGKYVQLASAMFGPNVCLRSHKSGGSPIFSILFEDLPIIDMGHDALGCVADQITHKRLSDVGRSSFGLVFRRGGCPFVKKVQTAQSLGATFLIVVNNEDELIGMSAGDFPHDAAQVRIPSFLITGASFRNHFAGRLLLSTPRGDILPPPPPRIICTENAVAQFQALGVRFHVPPTKRALYIFRERYAPIVQVVEEHSFVAARSVPPHAQAPPLAPPAPSSSSAASNGPTRAQPHTGWNVGHLVPTIDDIMFEVAIVPLVPNADEASTSAASVLTKSGASWLHVEGQNAVERLVINGRLLEPGTRAQRLFASSPLSLASSSVAAFNLSSKASSSAVGQQQPSAAAALVVLYNLASTSTTLVERFLYLTACLVRQLETDRSANGITHFYFSPVDATTPEAILQHPVQLVFMDVLLFDSRVALEAFRQETRYEMGPFTGSVPLHEQRMAYASRATEHVFDIKVIRD